jgi:2-methylisocitrate lyase-like PEP mutase family enzyme
MNNEAQKQKAGLFRRLHRGDSILVLPNAWDCLSATIFEQAGFPALATTSGGVASVLGYPDGQQIPSRLMLGMVGRISSVVSVPVTADLEAGYGRTPAQIAQTIINAIELGIVGINFEDGTGVKDFPLRDIEEQVDLIKSIRKAAEVTQIPLFINARTDVFLHREGDDAKRRDEAIQRAAAYVQAGADGIFVIGVKEPELIRELTRQIAAPVNILLGPGMPSIDQLHKLGVARVTFGSGLLRAGLPSLRAMARELRSHGTCPGLSQMEFTHVAINQLFQSKLSPIGESYFDLPQPKILAPGARPSPEPPNLTPRAQQALALGRKEADRRNDNFVGTEHILLGIIALGQGVANNVLQKQGLNLDEVRKSLEEHMGPGGAQKIYGHIPYTPRVKTVLAMAAKEAKALNHQYAGTEHLLLALLREEQGLAGRILREYAIDLDRTRNEILKELDPNSARD